MQSLDWFTIGRVALLYDLVGAFILAWGYVLQGKKDFKAAVSFYGPSTPLVPVATKFDSIVGLSFIALGFLGQPAGTDSDTVAEFSSCRVYPISTLIVLVVGGGGYLLFRKVLFSLYIVHLNKEKPNL